MKASTLSSRISKNNSCKTKYPQLLREIRSAVKRYPGGFTTISASTSVCSSTLSDQINLGRNGDFTALTLLDLLVTLNHDPYFKSYFIQTFLTDDERPCGYSIDASIMDLLSSAGEIVHECASALADGNISRSERESIKSKTNSLQTALNALNSALAEGV